MASLYDFSLMIIFSVVLCQVHGQEGIEIGSSYVFLLKFIFLLAAAGVKLSLNGTFIANNSYVDIDDIGEGDDALLCHTNKTKCCGSPFRIGEWYYPNGTRVVDLLQVWSQDEFYRNRGTQVVRLSHRQGTFTERGRFRCDIPDTRNDVQSIYAYIGMPIPW
jgi:hypothetical protein